MIFAVGLWHKREQIERIDLLSLPWRNFFAILLKFVFLLKETYMAMAALCDMVMARDNSAYRYGASFCGSTICVFMAFSIPQIRWALPSSRFRASAANSAGHLLHPGLGAPRLLVSHTWVPAILAVMARFSLFRSTHNHCWEHVAEDLFAHSFRIERHLPPP